MSGIAGVLQQDGATVDSERLAAMSEALAHRGPDDARTWIEGPVGLAHRAFWTTPEATRERQPLHDAASRLCVVFDGRLDDREALAGALRDAGFPPREDTDAELVLRAYEAWGEDCARHLIGDFALAVWDGGRRRLYCARDALAIRPFHYVRGPGFFAFASELGALLRDPRVGREPNEGMVGEYLALQMVQRDETLFRDIRRLPGGHSLTVDAAGQATVRRYWSLEGIRLLDYRTDGEYAEHFLEVMRQAIAPRLRAHGPVGTQLSGGQDSSTVSVLAHGLCKEAARPAPRTYSVAYPGLDCDESALIRAIQAFDALEGPLLEKRDPGIEHYDRVLARTHDFPGYPNGTPETLTLADAMTADGCRVALTGVGGNECFEGGLEWLAEAVSHGRLVPAWREAWASRRAYRGSAARLFYRYGLRPLWRDRRDAQGLVKPKVPWIDPAWMRRTALLDRLQRTHPAPPGATPTQRHVHELTTGSEEAHTLELLEASSHAAGVELRHPMLDRRVVEFAYALPGEQRWREGRPKTLLTHAMQGRLPPAILERTEQADFTSQSIEALDAVRERWPMGEWLAGTAGWVDAERLEREYVEARERHRQSGTPSFVFRGAWTAFGISLWARAHGRT